MARKNLLAGLTEPKLPAGNSPLNQPSEQESAQSPTPRLGGIGGRGAIGAVTRSLEHLKSQVGEAKQIQSQLASGQTIVELDPSTIDSSFIADRLPGSLSDHAALVDSIREHGQQIPILVRPSRDVPGRYQIAYGHRRLRALTELGRKVRAVVKDLSDAELVVAQGQENSARTDLSFIERALFAARLEEGGFERETIMAALTVDKTGLSRLISAAVKIPKDIIEAVGPAPRAGRDRWLELAERLQENRAGDISRKVIESSEFQAASSDERFLVLLAALAPKKSKPEARSWTGDDGKRVASIRQDERTFTLIVDKKTAPEFGDFLLEQLPDIYRQFNERRQG